MRGNIFQYHLRYFGEKICIVGLDLLDFDEKINMTRQSTERKTGIF